MASGLFAFFLCFNLDQIRGVFFSTLRCLMFSYKRLWAANPWLFSSPFWPFSVNETTPTSTFLVYYAEALLFLMFFLSSPDRTFKKASESSSTRSRLFSSTFVLILSSHVLYRLCNLGIWRKLLICVKRHLLSSWIKVGFVVSSQSVDCLASRFFSR
jgi:hypothetical protein